MNDKEQKAREYALNMYKTDLGYDKFDIQEAYEAGWDEAMKNADENTSDGYHTFKELYEYRLLYNAAFFNELAKHGICSVVKSKKHNDGEDCFGGGWFVVMAELPTGQISNHYELKDWGLFKCKEVEVAPKWDGHTPQEAAERIKRYLVNNK